MIDFLLSTNNNITFDRDRHPIKAGMDVLQSSLTYWVIAGAIVLIIAIMLLVRSVRARNREKRYLRCAGCYHKFKNMVVNCSGKRPITHYNLPHPSSNRSCTYSMWINIQNWYHNYGAWKNVFYKGKPIASDCTSGLKWDHITDQCPGVWLGEQTNNLRVGVVTNVSVPSHCLGKSTSPAAKDNGALPSGDDSTLDAVQCARTNSRRAPMDQMKILEYGEVKDVPIGEWFMFTVVMTSRRMELYINGKLWITKVFLGTPAYNNENGFFAAGNDYAGTLSNFRYLPHSLPSFMVEHLYKKEYAQSFRTREADDIEH